MCKNAVILLGDNIGENLDDLEYDDNFLNTTSKAQSWKEIIDHLYFIEIKTSAL